MTEIISLVFSLPAIVLLTLALFLLVEIVGAIATPMRSKPKKRNRQFKVAVVIPAHNEGHAIVSTLVDVKAQMLDGDRMIVVADNCDDETASIAIQSGAECFVRKNKNLRGKGYALQFALDKLKSEPPDIVFFLDADCRLHENAMDEICIASLDVKRPAQGMYLMQAPKDAPASRRVAEFAWALINRVRMAGLYRLFDTTRLTGAGMAMPWSLAEKLQVGSGEIVEDLSLSLDLTKSGTPPILVSSAYITSEFPMSDTAAATQRARWEHGSMRLARRNLIGLLANGLFTGNPRLVAMALDLAIPPLAIFAGFLGISFIVAGALALFGVLAPFILVFGACLVFTVAIMASWIFFGREILPMGSLFSLGDFLSSKRNVYGETARKSTTTWTRTDRSTDSSAK